MKNWIWIDLGIVAPIIFLIVVVFSVAVVLSRYHRPESSGRHPFRRILGNLLFAAACVGGAVGISRLAIVRRSEMLVDVNQAAKDQILTQQIELQEARVEVARLRELLDFQSGTRDAAIAEIAEYGDGFAIDLSESASDAPSGDAARSQQESTEDPDAAADEIELATASPVEQVRPKWLQEPPKAEDHVRFVVVHTDPLLSRDLCADEFVKKLKDALQTYVRQFALDNGARVPAGFHVTDAELQEIEVRETYVEELDLEIGTMYCQHGLAAIGKDFQDLLSNRIQQTQLQQHMAVTGAGVGSLLLLLGASYGGLCWMERRAAV